MAVYECLFFTEDRLDYWENIECPTLVQLASTVRMQIAAEKFEHAEAWYRDALVLEMFADDRAGRPRLRFASA